MIEEKISIYNTKQDELPLIRDMEQGKAQEYIIPYSLQRHQAEFEKEDVVYKSIRADGEMTGFMILVLDPDDRSIELRRIVIAKPDRGYGKKAIRMVDQICQEQPGRNRIWLDVFETNARARAVYEQCGFRPFGTSEHEGRKLLLYEKSI